MEIVNENEQSFESLINMYVPVIGRRKFRGANNLFLVIRNNDIVGKLQEAITSDISQNIFI